MYTILHGTDCLQVQAASNVTDEIVSAIETWKGLASADYYLTQSGRSIGDWQNVTPYIPLRINERLRGGKGGFGSMLRAIGAQIEKTTNREACRDLCGRRLRDINEEKRLKAYLEKQQNASEDERQKIQLKIDKLLAKPKHEFEDRQYESVREELIVRGDDAIQAGLQQLQSTSDDAKEATGKPSAGLKRKGTSGSSKISKKKQKSDLWLGMDDMSSASDSDDSNSNEPSSDYHSGSGSSEELSLK
ncbi:replication stress response regulator SDE2 [Anopheles aquasalis]|uniref:replication stress response regulator SDE2 n=1 Tax=Anopheles aquasalis TaxID=42839 RepID=UPI00215A5454|nr:replication stress response regulator SDE2 [Anopheles aquasalis]XP_050087104.1 replication stress response regulator SDE2 [Anopheles aquasalis]XP_050087112.1 replication stress response regulator SDE2 [Anopheles aquasalis]